MPGEPLTARSRWRVARVVFRWCRILLLALALGVLGFALYLNRVGLPGFLRDRVLAELRGQGLELQCERLRWAFYRGVLASGVTFGPPETAEGLRASAREVTILPDLSALWEGRLVGRRIAVYGGNLSFTWPGTNGPPLVAALTNLQAQIEFLADGEVELTRLNARLGQVEFQLNGTIVHAAELAQVLSHDRAARPPGTPPATARDFLRDQVEIWRQCEFAGQPEVRLHLTADAREWRRTRGLLTVTAPAARTPWGDFTNFQATARLEPARWETTLPFGWVRLTAAAASTPWASGREVTLRFDCPPSDQDTNSVDAAAVFSASEVTTRWGEAAQAEGSIEWTQSLTNPVPLRAEGSLRLRGAETPWAEAGEAGLTGKFWQTFEPAPAEWGWWTNLAPFGAVWQVEATDVLAQGVHASYAACEGAWERPVLTLSNLHAEVWGGRLSLGARCDVATRAAAAQILTDCDVLAFQPQLPAGLSNWLNRIRYEGRPDLFAEARGVLPPWTDPPERFGETFLPTFEAGGHFLTGPGAYLDMEVTSAEGQISYSNRVLRIPALRATRTEGEVALRHVANEVTDDAYWGIRSSIDPNVARPVLGEEVEAGLDQVKFSTPPELELELWLNDSQGGLLGLRGAVAMTNAIVRDQPTQSLRARVDFTNNVLRLFAPEIHFDQGAARADGVTLEIEPMRLTLTNAFSDTDPARILAAIGDPELTETLSDYRFDAPPTVRLEGTIPLKGGPGFDLRAEVEGGPFHWWRLSTPEVRGRVRYTGDRLELLDMTGEFCEGASAFEATFDLSRAGAARYAFTATVTNANLGDLIKSLAHTTNEVAGRLDLRLHITNAWTTDLDTWNGDGGLALRDGFLWEQPFFDVLSGFINAITPGLGSARFRSGHASVAITNGVFHSKDILLDSALLQLRLRGTVNMDQKLDAVVQAKPLQTVGVIGPLINSILWPVTKAFEFRATGTLQDPLVEPEHAPLKVLFAPLRPVQTFRDLFGGGRKEEPVYKPIEPTAPPPK